MRMDYMLKQCVMGCTSIQTNWNNLPFKISSCWCDYWSRKPL